MSTRERISVVVPCFNHARHLEEALRSVAAQDYEQLELIVVDDASSDASARLAESLLASADFQRRFGKHMQLVVHDTNRGASAAINHGLTLANGHLVTILNSDDRYGPSRIATLRREMRDRGSRLAFSGVRYIDEWSQELPVGPEVLPLSLHQSGLGRYPTIGFACLCGNAAITSGNLLFERRLLDEIGGFRDLRYCHDWDFLLRSVAICEPLYVPPLLYDYRLHGANAFRLLQDRAERETREVLACYLETVRRESLDNPLAPSPSNWPGVFQYVLRRQGLWHHW